MKLCSKWGKFLTWWWLKFFTIHFCLASNYSTIKNIQILNVRLIFFRGQFNSIHQHFDVSIDLTIPREN